MIYDLADVVKMVDEAYDIAYKVMPKIYGAIGDHISLKMFDLAQEVIRAKDLLDVPCKFYEALPKKEQNMIPFIKDVCRLVTDYAKLCRVSNTDEVLFR